jgi:hypothetical protein
VSGRSTMVSKKVYHGVGKVHHCVRNRDEQWLSRESRSQWFPPVFWVSIPVSISRLWSQKSRFQSRYQDSNFRVSIPVSISRLKFQKSRFQSQYQDSTMESLNFSLDVQTWLLNLQPLSKPWPWLCKAKNTRKCNLTNLQNPPVQQNCCNFWANVIICCPVRCWISFILLVY